MNTIVVTGNLVSKNGITLFTSDGESIVLNQEAFNTRSIMERIMPELITNGQCKIDLNEFSIKNLANLKVDGVDVGDDGSLEIEVKDGTKVNATVLTHEVGKIVSGNSPKALTEFLKKVKKIKRGHTADELLSFVSNGDMPVANDGSLIAYKRLRTVDAEKGIMADPHTGKVLQSLGSIVFMPESKVNDNRSQLCSTGLHVGARQYISNFSGDKLCLIKIDPQNIVAVPHRENTKMRVSAYHIVHVLSDEHMSLVIGNGDLFEDEGLRTVFANVIAGNHPGILNRVEVGKAGEFKASEVEQKKPTTVRVRPRPVADPRSPVTKGKTGMSPKEVKDLMKTAAVVTPKDTSKKPASDFETKVAAAIAAAKKLLKTKKGKAEFSLRAFAKEHGVSRDALTRRLRDAGLID